MRLKIAVSLLLCFSNCCTCLVAQQNWLGTKTPYTPQQQRETLPPPGYIPIFINHVGRHGARFLTKPGSDIGALKVLDSAFLKKALTAKGDELRRNISLFTKVEASRYGLLTLDGREEQQSIGARMYARYGNIFKQKNTVVYTTFKERTKQSAASFLKAFANSPTQRLSLKILPDSADDILRFYDVSPAYQQYEKSSAVTSRTDTLLNDALTVSLVNRVCEELFLPRFLKALKKGLPLQLNNKVIKVTATDFVLYLYDLYCMQWLVKKDVSLFSNKRFKFTIANIFTDTELMWLNKLNSAADFFEKGPASDTLGIQVRIAAPLLVDFINTTDEALQGNSNGAILRFSHAETVSPFATLLGIPAASIPSASVYDYDHHWNAASIIPMSANIQWIFFKNNNDDCLVKMLLNEKETAFPIHTDHFPFYPWKEVRAYYINKLAQLNVRLNDNMHSYLQNLQ